jgi:hypothetical protein
LPDHARCAACGYELRGLTQSRCPECGKAFDPSNQDTFRQPGDVPRQVRRLLWRSRAVLRWPPLHWVLLAVIATALVALMSLRGLRFWDNLIWHGVLSFGLGWGLWAVILHKAFKVVAGPRRSLVRAALAIVTCALLLTIPLSWTLGFDRCPHGRWVIVGPHVTGFCIDGRPCRNPRMARTVWDRWLGRPGLSHW